MRQPLENMRIFQERRQKVGDKLKDGILVVASMPEAKRNGNVEHPFRQDSNLYYLTGFEEPQSIFVFRPGRKPETVMFLREKDATRETWDGFRFGTQQTVKDFKIDEVYPIEEFPKHITALMNTADSLYFRFHKNPEVDRWMNEALLAQRLSMGRSGLGLLPVYDADEFLGEFRVIKDDYALHNHRTACELTAEAHTELMKYIKPGVNEREAEGFFIYQVMKRGAARMGYNSIMAGGANACTLHYVFNDEKLKDGDLFLVDAAGEYNYFTSDITRTYPVNGKFSAAQAEVYQAVLDVQKKVINAVKPGVPFNDLQDLGTQLLTEAMLELGLFSGRKEDIIAGGLQKKYYPHGIGHFLGMDVHDAGLYRSRSGQRREIEAGMVFTVEPGLYIPVDDKEAAERYRGIGVRIEDDILVTNSGFEVLTKACPKEIVEIEKLMAKN
jgi:Xaa-Pro aminopeptidase